MKKRLLGILFSLALMLTMMPGMSLTAYADSEKTVTYNLNDDGREINKDGVTCTKSFDTANNIYDGGTFFTSSGTFTGIVVNAKTVIGSGEGWSSNTWTGNSSSVQFDSIRGATENVTITFTIATKDPVPYIDADGSKKSCTDYKVVEDSDTNVVWGEDGKTTWYVVNDNVRISGGVEIDGDVNLILCDGAKLTVVGEFYSGNDSSITIYAQSTSGSMGSLEASSPIYVEDVTINGGAINARGIGAVNTATINGGTVNTNGGDGRPGIYTTDGAVTINGGNVEATGIVGIQAYDKLIIEDGIIRATGNSAGIGGLTVTINNGTIEAKATDGSGAYGIFGGGGVTIKDGQVTASGSTAGISGYVKNFIAGTGWKDTEGKEGKTVIAIDREGKELTFKKVQFPEVVTVTFDSAGGSDVADQTIEKGTKATKPADPTRSGYTFDGWYLDSTAFDFSKPVEEDITLTAHWKQVTQSTITYDLNGGTLNGETGKVAVKVNNGTVITLPEPTRDGYTFDYWEGSKYNAGDKYTVNGDHTFKAVWKTADKGGGSDSGDKGGSSSGKKGVNTGDENNLGAWIVLLFAALTGTTGMVFARKRK